MSDIGEKAADPVLLAAFIAEEDQIRRKLVAAGFGSFEPAAPVSEIVDAAIQDLGVTRNLLAGVAAERDALQAKLSDIEAETRRRAESADPNDETWYTRTEYFLRINAETENARLKAELAAVTTERDDAIARAEIADGKYDALAIPFDEMAAACREAKDAKFLGMKGSDIIRALRTERDDALALSRRMADVVGAAEFREASAAIREKSAWAEVERLRVAIAKAEEENGGCSICAAVSGEAQANRISFGQQLKMANDAQEQIARKLAEAQAAQRGAVAALVQSEAEVAVLKAAMRDSIDQIKRATNLLAQVMQGAYQWPSGVAWVVGEVHQQLTGGALDGLYTHAQAANSGGAVTTEDK